MINPIFTPLPPEISEPIIIISSTLRLVPLRNMWLKFRSQNVVLIERFGYAIIVKYHWTGILIYIPNESYRRLMSKEHFSVICKRDVRFSFEDSYDLQVPKQSNEIELLQLLVPIVREKWELMWLSEDLEKIQSELTDLVGDLTVSCYKDQATIYQLKLEQVNEVIKQVDELVAEYEQYIQQVEVALKIIQEYPDIKSSLPNRQNLIERSLMLQEKGKRING